MSEAATAFSTSAELMGAARWYEAHGNVIAAICTYREVIRAGVEPAAAEARLRVAALARGSETGLPG
jgi:hypothetical protein